MKRSHVAIVFLLFLLVSNFADAQGCSQCKLLAEQSSEVGPGSFARGINKGILFLMIIPYVLLLLLFRKKLRSLFRSLFQQ